MNERRIRFTTAGSTLDNCDEAARAICQEALGDWYHLTSEGYSVLAQTSTNEVVAWNGEYSANPGGPR